MSKLTQVDLDKVEYIADTYFKKLGLDIEFTKHFLDRVNDERNKKQITVDELNALFKSIYIKYKYNLTELNQDYNGVFKDIWTDINSPFVINYDYKENDINIVLKTIMRKKNFKTTNKFYTVNTNENLIFESFTTFFKSTNIKKII